jgi:predicted nucleic acid-binding protein
MNHGMICLKKGHEQEIFTIQVNNYLKCKRCFVTTPITQEQADNMDRRYNYDHWAALESATAEDAQARNTYSETLLKTEQARAGSVA